MGRVYEELAGSTGTTVTTGSTNTKGSYSPLTTTTRDICGIDIFMCNGTNSVVYIFDLAIGTDIIIPNIYARGGTQGGQRISIPGFFIPAGSALQLRAQSGSASATTSNFYLRGRNFMPGDAIKFCRADCLDINLTNSRAGNAQITADSSWTQVSASTSRDYKALAAQIGPYSTNPATSQVCSFGIGVGGSGSEVSIGTRFISRSSSSSPYFMDNIGPLVERDIPSGSRLCLNETAATTTDVSCGSILAFY